LKVAFSGTYAPPSENDVEAEFAIVSDFANIEFYLRPKEGIIGIFYRPVEIIWRDFPNPGSEIPLKKLEGYRKNLSSSNLIKP
jgi:hypothetical protein